MRAHASRSPGRTGTSQRISSTPGAPIDDELRRNPSATIRIIMQQVCQPEAHKAADDRRARGLLIEMHRLRVELRRELLDLVGGDERVAIFGNSPGREIFEIELWHDCPTVTVTDP